MRRPFLGVAILTACVLLLHTPEARAQQALSFELGEFTLRPVDSRVAGDVLVTNQGYLVFGIRDFRAWAGGVEWLAQTGDKIETGIGVGYYQRQVPSFYAEWDNQGSDINQDLKLRIVPLFATVKFLPFGHRSVIQPYVGGGIAIYFWRYSESGDFLDFNVPDPSHPAIFPATFVSSGTSVGPVATAGVRARLSKDVSAGVEVRAQWGEGSLSRDFLSDKIDLGGVNVLATLRVRF